MADEAAPPPALETKDLPYAAVPAPVPHVDRIGYEIEPDEDALDTEAAVKASGKPARGKAATDKE